MPGMGVVRGVSNHRSLEDQIQRQMGCMSGFLQRFDRPQMLVGKRLPAPSVAGSTSPSDQSDASTISSTKEVQSFPFSQEIPLQTSFSGGHTLLRAASQKPREAPRLSLDSLASIDENQEKRRRSPSVVARLMGLEELPVDEHAVRSELRRSASESRLTLDLSHFNLQKSFPAQENFKPKKQGSSVTSTRETKPQFQKKSFFDANEFFPQLHMRGSEEPTPDLETLNQTLEALHLKGLLRSKQPDHQKNACSRFSPIVLMKPTPKLTELPLLPSRSVSPSMPASKSSAKIRLKIDRDLRSTGLPSPRPITARNSGDPPTRRKLFSDDRQMIPLSQRRIPAVPSPKSSPKKLGSGQMCSPKNRRPTTGKSSAFQFESEREKSEDYSSGRKLLERCDKLLHSIAAISSLEEQAIHRQLSPVSVLDSSLLSDESLVTSPPKPATGCNDQSTVWNEDHCNHQPTPSVASTSPQRPHKSETTVDLHKHQDYAFVANILCESNLHHSSDDTFTSIENRQHSAVFDSVTELASQKRRSPLWNNFSSAVAPGDVMSLTREVWEELCRIQERVPAENVLEAACGAIRKDMAAGSDREREWWVFRAEMSEVVLHCERLVFKDLVVDTIRELANLSGNCRRKLIFCSLSSCSN